MVHQKLKARPDVQKALADLEAHLPAKEKGYHRSIRERTDPAASEKHRGHQHWVKERRAADIWQCASPGVYRHSEFDGRRGLKAKVRESIHHCNKIALTHGLPHDHIQQRGLEQRGHLSQQDEIDIRCERP